MTTEAIVRLKCDNNDCNATFKVETNKIGYAYVRAKDEGWECYLSSHFCPLHAGGGGL